MKKLFILFIFISLFSCDEKKDNSQKITEKQMAPASEYCDYLYTDFNSAIQQKCPNIVFNQNKEGYCNNNYSDFYIFGESSPGMCLLSLLDLKNEIGNNRINSLEDMINMVSTESCDVIKSQITEPLENSTSICKLQFAKAGYDFCNYSNEFYKEMLTEKCGEEANSLIEQHNLSFNQNYCNLFYDYPYISLVSTDIVKDIQSKTCNDLKQYIGKSIFDEICYLGRTINEHDCMYAVDAFGRKMTDLDCQFSLGFYMSSCDKYHNDSEISYEEGFNCLKNHVPQTCSELELLKDKTLEEVIPECSQYFQE